MASFQTKPPVLVHFGSPLNGKFRYILLSFGIPTHVVAICFISRQFGKCFGDSLKYPDFGILFEEKSGNPAALLFYGK
jgi:hypothetical protein